VTGLFALGETKGVFEKGTSTDAPFPCTYNDCEGTVSIESWKARTDARSGAASRSSAAPTTRTRAGGGRSPTARWPSSRSKGWTDDLFPAVESFRIFKYLKRLDPKWPVELALADVGHSRAQNKPDTWRPLNAEAFQWLESNIGGRHEQRTTVSSEATVCGDGAPAQALAATPEGLANGMLSVDYPGGETISPLGIADPNGPATDAIAGPAVQPGEQCRHSDGPVPPGAGYMAYSQPLDSARTYVGIGTVRVPYVWAGAASGQLDARLFDVAPDGTELLATRGTYRLENDAPTGVITLPFYGNHCASRPGTGSASTSRRSTPRPTVPAISRARSSSSRA
jgi:hypothetical protein